MKTATAYICEYCSKVFLSPCEEHEVDCKAEKRYYLLQNILLGEKMDSPVGARIKGEVFIINSPVRFNNRTIKIIATATELLSTAERPSDNDVVIINKVNKILQS